MTPVTVPQVPSGEAEVPTWADFQALDADHLALIKEFNALKAQFEAIAFASFAPTTDFSLTDNDLTVTRSG